MKFIKIKKIVLCTLALTTSLFLSCNSFGAAEELNGDYGESTVAPLSSVNNQEPNDSISTATDISSLTYRDAVVGFISSSSDVDFYKYKTTSSQSGKMKMVLSNPSENYNYSVMIYKGSAADVCGKIETSGDKTVLFSVSPNTTYYIKIYSANSKFTATEPYTFTLQHYSAGENLYGKLGWAYPLPSGYTTVSSYQCLKGDYGYTAANEHSGIDLPTGDKNNPNNNPNPNIYNTAKGVVRSAGFSNALGYYVFMSPLLYEPNSVNSSGRFVVRYLHMQNTPNVSAGQTVSRGTVLGNVGNTGTSTGNHLHIDINNIDEGGGPAMRSHPANVINPILFYPNVNFTRLTSEIEIPEENIYESWFYSIETVISNEVDQAEYERFIEMYYGTPNLNIVNFVNYFNYPKELFESIVEEYNLDWYDADIIYSNDEALIAEFFGLN